MRQIEVWYACESSSAECDLMEVEETANDDEIDVVVREWALEKFSWGWKKLTPESKSSNSPAPLTEAEKKIMCELKKESDAPSIFEKFEQCVDIKNASTVHPDAIYMRVQKGMSL